MKKLFGKFYMQYISRTFDIFGKHWISFANIGGYVGSFSKRFPSRSSCRCPKSTAQASLPHISPRRLSRDSREAAPPLEPYEPLLGLGRQEPLPPDAAAEDPASGFWTAPVNPTDAAQNPKIFSSRS